MKIERMIMLGFVGALSLGCSPNPASVIYPELESAEAERPTSGGRPEVLLLTSHWPVSGDGLRVPVARFEDVLQLRQCSSRAVYQRLLDRFGKQWTVWGQSFCTGTFVADDQIVTAAHCLKSTKWSRTYAITGFVADHGWPVEDGVMTIPATNVIPLCHVEVCTKEQLGDGTYIDDFAIVHVCPDSTAQAPRSVRTLIGDGSPTDLEGLVVYSHAWGLPLKKYQALADPERSVAMFTNAGGGSGSALINRHGEVIAVTSGRTNNIDHVVCPGGGSLCDGQPMDWYSEIHRFRTERTQCRGLVDFATHEPQTCEAVTQ